MLQKVHCNGILKILFIALIPGVLVSAGEKIQRVPFASENKADHFHQQLSFQIFSSFFILSQQNASSFVSRFLFHRDTFNFYAKIKFDCSIFENSADKSSQLGIAHRDSYYPVISVGDSWCAIIYNKKNGWVERNAIDVVTAQSMFRSLSLRFFILSATGICGIVLLIQIMLKTKKRSKPAGETDQYPILQKSNKKALILSSDASQVIRYITKDNVPLEKVLAEVGFNVTTVSQISTAGKFILKYTPDLAAVDWNVSPTVMEDLEEKLSIKTTTSNVFIIYYNVPQETIGKQSSLLPNTQFLGTDFADRDLFNIITPYIITGERKQEILKSVETAALKGNLSLGSLVEVFQFIEIGRKTGELQISPEADRSFEMPSGIINFKDGIIINATYSIDSGRDAVFKLLELKNGHFRFVQNKLPQVENCKLPAFNVLMEWTKIIDETSRNRLRQT